MALNHYLNNTYGYVLRGFLEGDPQALSPAGPIVPAAAGVNPPAALEAWVPDSTGKRRLSGHYPYYSLGYLNFDGNGNLAGASVAVNIGGHATAPPSPRTWDTGTYEVADDGRWGSGALSVLVGTVQHSLQFRFVMIQDGHALDFVITGSAPRRVAASGTMTLLHTPNFALLYKFLRPWLLWPRFP